MVPGCVIFPILASRVHLERNTHGDAPPFSFSTTQIRHNPGWSVTAAALLCHASEFLSIIIVLWCQRGAHLKLAGASFFPPGFRRGNKTATRDREIPGPPCGWRTTFAAVCVLCWWRCVLGETKATNYPPSPSQGQGWWVWRETSCRSLDLRGCASPFLCSGGSASARYRQNDPDLNSGSGGGGGEKERTVCKTTRGSHGMALQSYLTWAQRRLYMWRKNKKQISFDFARFSSDCGKIDKQHRQPISVIAPFISHAPEYVIPLFCFVSL